MLEFLLCSLVTILPDYLIRRYVNGKRWGHEITFFTVWYELRWGITACFMLTIALITLIFYYHPSTTNVTPVFRTVTILPEYTGRVDEVYVANGQNVKAGDPLFSIQEASQLAELNTARAAVATVEAEFATARTMLAEADARVESVAANLAQARSDLSMKIEFARKDRQAISERAVIQGRNRVASLEGDLAAVKANRDQMATRLDTILPAELEAAKETLGQTEVELDKTDIYAGINGRVTQFFLHPGDIVNPLLRPAGLLIPTDTDASGKEAIQAGFNQLAAPIIKPGTLIEVTCLSKPFTIVPLVVTAVQPMIAAGQIRPTDQLVDLLDRARPGTLTVRMEPLYEGGMEGIIPGSKCIANAYTNNHELIASGELGLLAYLYYHMVDTVGIVHAVILRIQALMIPVKYLVFAGH